MQNPALFHVLLDYLEANGTAAADIQLFVDRWHRLRPHEAFPCPVCCPPLMRMQAIESILASY
jgi:hypothetical protein